MSFFSLLLLWCQHIAVVLLSLFETVDSTQEAIMPSDRSAVRIVIVGAGMAGLGAANGLINKYGFTNVTVLEAQNRIGGRVLPIPYDDGYLQLGAEFLHATTNPIAQIVKKLKLSVDEHVTEVYNDPYEYTYLTEGGSQIDSDAAAQLDCSMLAEEIENDLYRKGKRGMHKGKPLGELTRRRLQQLVNRQGEEVLDNNRLNGLLANLKHFIEIENGIDDWNLAEIRQFTHYGEWDEYKDVLLDKAGYQAVLQYILARLPNNVIKLNQPVDTIDHSNGHVITIHKKDGTTTQCDHIIVTCSLGYLKDHEHKMFQPQLSRKKRTAIRTIGMGTVDKIFLRFDEKWWDDKLIALEFIRSSPSSNQESDLEKMFWRVHVHPSFGDTLVAFVGGKYAAIMEAAADNKVTDAFMKVARRFTRLNDIPTPTQIIRTKWKNDPYTLGGYSYYTLESYMAGVSRDDLAQPIPRVLFAGEATSAFKFQTVHGAYLTGQREATRLHRLYGE